MNCTVYCVYVCMIYELQGGATGGSHEGLYTLCSVERPDCRSLAGGVLIVLLARVHQ